MRKTPPPQIEQFCFRNSMGMRKAKFLQQKHRAFSWRWEKGRGGGLVFFWFSTFFFFGPRVSFVFFSSNAQKNYNDTEKITKTCSKPSEITFQRYFADGGQDE